MNIYIYIYIYIYICCNNNSLPVLTGESGRRGAKQGLDSGKS